MIRKYFFRNLSLRSRLLTDRENVIGEVLKFFCLAKTRLVVGLHKMLC